MSEWVVNEGWKKVSQIWKAIEKKRVEDNDDILKSVIYEKFG